jgi:hypothetical protein
MNVCPHDESVHHAQAGGHEEEWRKREALQVKHKQERQRELGMQMMVLMTGFEGRVTMNRVWCRTGENDKRVKGTGEGSEQTDSHTARLSPGTDPTSASVSTNNFLGPKAQPARLRASRNYQASPICNPDAMRVPYSRPSTTIDYKAEYATYNEYDGCIGDQSPMTECLELFDSIPIYNRRMSLDLGQGGPTNSDMILCDKSKACNDVKDKELQERETSVGASAYIFGFDSVETKHERCCLQLATEKSKTQDSVLSIPHAVQTHTDHQPAGYKDEKDITLFTHWKSSAPQPQMSSHPQHSTPASSVSPTLTFPTLHINFPYSEAHLDLIDKWETSLHHLEHLSEASENAEHRSHAGLLAHLGRTLDAASSVPQQCAKWMYRLEQLSLLQQEARMEDHRLVAGWLLDFVKKLEGQLDKLQADVMSDAYGHEEKGLEDMNRSGDQPKHGRDDCASLAIDTQSQPIVIESIKTPSSSSAPSGSSPYPKGYTLPNIVKELSGNIPPLSEHSGRSLSPRHHYDVPPVTSPNTSSQNGHDSLLLKNKPLPPLPLRSKKSVVPLRTSNSMPDQVDHGPQLPFITSTSTLPLLRPSIARQTSRPSISESAIERWLTPSDDLPAREVSSSILSVQALQKLPTRSSPDFIPTLPVSLPFEPTMRSARAKDYGASHPATLTSRHSFSSAEAVDFAIPPSSQQQQQQSSQLTRHPVRNPTLFAHPVTYRRSLEALLSSIRSPVRSLSTVASLKQPLSPSAARPAPRRSALHSSTLRPSIFQSVRKKVNFKELDEILVSSNEEIIATQYHTYDGQDPRKQVRSEQQMREAEGKALHRGCKTEYSEEERKKSTMDLQAGLHDARHEISHWNVEMHGWEGEKQRPTEWQKLPRDMSVTRDLEYQRLWRAAAASFEARQRALDQEIEEREEQKTRERRKRKSK